MTDRQWLDNLNRDQSTYLIQSNDPITSPRNQNVDPFIRRFQITGVSVFFPISMPPTTPDRIGP